MRGQPADVPCFKDDCAMKIETRCLNVLLCAVAAGAVAVVAAEPLRITVDPSGPIKTPAAARDALRRMRAEHGGRLPDGGAVVTLADGEYRLDEPLELDGRDSGTASSPVVWRAAARGNARLSGARDVTVWRPVADAKALALLPPAARGHVLEADVPWDGPIPDFGGGSEECYARRLNYPLWLYQSGRRLAIASFPNLEEKPERMAKSYIFTGRTVGGEVNVGSLGKRSISGVFVCDRPELDVWAKEPELWVYGMFLHEYADMKMAVTNIDLSARTMALDNRWYPRGFKRDAPFRVINALSALDSPGEWVMDRTRRKLYLWPIADVSASPPAIGATMDLVSGSGVSHVSFEGLDFSCPRRDALRFRDSTNVTVRACRIRLSGAWGVRFLGGEMAKVSGCDLADLGEGGVELKGGDQPSLRPARHVVDNCHIEHYGQVIPSYRPGVSLSGVGNVCTHNLIHHTVHQGVWFNGNDHRIAFNVIHDTCQYNDDAGAIYCCQRDWTKRGTVIEYNLIHQTGKRPYPTMNDAIYLDDFSSGNVVRGNIVNGGTLGVHIGGGNGNTVVSNVLVACETGIRVSSRRGAHFGGVHKKGEESYLYKQLLRDRARYEDGLWRSRYPEMARLLAMPDKYLAHDPLFNRIKDNVLASSGDLLLPPTKESIPYFDVTNNVFVDGADVFVDFRGLDFRIRPGSAAWRIVGDLPVERMGLYASPDRLTPAVRFGQDVARPAGPPKRPFSPAVVRIDVHTPKLPDGVEALALDDMRNCDLLASQKGRRVYAIVASRAPGEWTEYSFAFTPACDAVCTFALSGGYGGKTEYAAIRAEGLDIADGGFMQENTFWRNASGGDPRGRGDNGPPYGPQRGFAVANHVRQTVQTVHVKKGVRVTVSFRARALP